MIKQSLMWMGVAALVACQGTDESVEEQQVGPPAASLDYPQLFGTPQHAGLAGVEQTGLRVVATIQQDSDVAKRLNTSGFLQVHEPAPIVKGDFVVVPTTQGFTEPQDFFEKSTTSYGLKAFKWSPSATAPGAVLKPTWSTITPAVLVDQAFCSFGCQTNGYESLFGPAVANGSVYSPGKSGQLVRYDLATGRQTAVIDPLAGTPFSNDPVTTVTSALTATRQDFGDVLYTVVAWATDTVNRGRTPRASWLVRVRPDNTTQVVEWHDVAVASLGIPQFPEVPPGDLCSYAFGTSGTPGPVDSTTRAPQFECGLQRPGLNTPPSVDANGDVVVWSYANNQSAAAFLIRLNGTTLRPIAASDMRGHALHGCGVRLTDDSDVCRIPVSCATITDGGATHRGFDPCTNEPVAPFGPDIDSNAITIAPNGDASIGAYDGGFVFGGDYDARGFGLTFRRDGSLRAANTDYYWDVTAGVRLDARSPGGFNYVHSRQRYSDFLADPLGVGIFTPDWALQSSGVVVRDPSTDPNVEPIDFLAAQPLFDSSGSYYAPNADGHLYKFSPKGQVLEVVDLLDGKGNLNSIFAVEGYGARDRLGRIYWSYGGYVYVVQGGGRAASTAQLRPTPAQSAAVRSGARLRAQGAHNAGPATPPRE